MLSIFKKISQQHQKIQYSNKIIKTSSETVTLVFCWFIKKQYYSLRLEKRKKLIFHLTNFYYNTEEIEKKKGLFEE